MTGTALKIRPLQTHVGAQLRGVALADVNEQTFSSIRDALQEFIAPWMPQARY